MKKKARILQNAPKAGRTDKREGKSSRKGGKGFEKGKAESPGKKPFGQERNSGDFQKAHGKSGEIGIRNRRGGKYRGRVSTDESNRSLARKGAVAVTRRRWKKHGLEEKKITW